MVKKSSKDFAYLKELILTDLSMIQGTLNPQFRPKQLAQSSFIMSQRTMTKSDEDIQAQVQVQTPIEESVQGLGGPITRARTKKAQEALKQLIATFHKDIQRQLKDVEHKENALILCLKAQVEEEFDTCI